MSTIYTDIYTDVEIDISNVCNLKCPLCHRNNFGEEAYSLNSFNMDVSHFERLLEVFPNLQRIYLGFMVCEPTLNPNFIDIVRFIKEKGLNITLSTNGNTYDSTSERSENFWKTFLGLLTKDDKIIWPVDGFTEEIYLKYRRGGNLMKVLRNIERATSIRPDINHTIQTIMFAHNKKEIDELYEEFKEMYKYRFNLPTWSLIDCCGDCAMLSEDVQPQWDKQQWIKIKSNPPKSPKSFRCESLDNKIVFVDHNGRIGFCPTQLTNAVANNPEVPTIFSPLRIINEYCRVVYANKHNNNICQFNCGTLAKLRKEKAGLNGIATK